jgi:hemin uptake protein HemP
MTWKDPDRAAIEPDKGASPHPVRIVLADLLEGRREAIIVHNGEEYRLRVTSRDKLILTK